MLQFIALQIARILFALRSVRLHHLIFAWLAVLTFARTPAYSALATFIAANGTTAQNWNIGGPNGPNWTNSSGTSVISAATQMSVDGPITAVGPSDATEIDIGNSLTEPVINIGDQTSSAFQLINIGNVGTGDTTLTINPGAGYATFLSGASEIFRLGPTFQPRNAASTLACGTGGTQTVATRSFGITVTTGTLTSNCIIDFSTNGPKGSFFVDLSGATVGATFGIVFKNGSTSSPTYTTVNHTSGNTLATVWTHGPSTLAVSY